MKFNLVRFVFIFVMISANLMAQETENKTFKLGIEGGVQFCDISDQYMISKSGTGFNFGAYIQYPINESLHIRLGLNYDNRAFNLKNQWRLVDDSTGYYGDSFYAENTDFSLNYATIPLSLLYTKGTGSFKLYFQFSIYYSLLLNASMDGMSEIFISAVDAQHFTYPEWQSPQNTSEPFSGDVTNEFNSYDLGINFYIGGVYKISDQLGITLSPGITYGMANVWANPERTANWSRLFKINAGVVYTLK